MPDSEAGIASRRISADLAEDTTHS
jgi:hypothetical protein